jgi:hypothetical protein
MEATNPGTLSDVSELETAVARLETAISEASLAVAALRACLPKIALLAETVNRVESAVLLSRPSVSADLRAA